MQRPKLLAAGATHPLVTGKVGLPVPGYRQVSPTLARRLRYYLPHHREYLRVLLQEQTRAALQGKGQYSSRVDGQARGRRVGLHVLAVFLRHSLVRGFEC